MKSAKKSKILAVVLSVVLLVAMAGMTVPALATDGGVILHPGYISGSVSVDGYNITRIGVGATDETKTYWATVGVNPPPSPSIDYTLTVEGGYNYYVVAWAEIVSTDPANPMDYTLAWLPKVGPYSVAVGETIPDVNMSMTPAFVEGTISTGSASDTIESFDLRARTYVPEYYQPNLDSRTRASGLTAPGDTRRDYRLLVAPGLDYRLWGEVVINGIKYDVPYYDFTAPGAGETLTKDLPFEVTRATVSGIARLEGPVDVDEAKVSVVATAYNPTRSISTKADPATGEYTLGLTADTWYLRAYFPFVHTGVGLEGVGGSLTLPRTAVTLTPDEYKTIDFIIEPGFITGTVSLTGANTEYVGAFIQADSADIPGGKVSSNINPENGKYMFVASPGASWRYGYWFCMYFRYYDESNKYIGYSDMWKYIGSDIYTVVSGETVAGLDLAFGTATVKLMYYVAGGGELSSPALRTYGNVIAMNVWGSNTKPTEGQTICTLIPGTYNISAWAVVDGSSTTFGTFTVTVAEGDMVVIGGVAGPTLKVTSPTEGAVIPAPSVIVEGTATDNVGIESITINGEDVTFSSTGNPADPNEVGFIHDVSLPDVGENAITVVAQDIDGMPEVTCSFKVIREVATTLTYTGDALAQVNTPAALAATLVDEDNNPVSGADISFQVADQSCSALTGADGVASCEVIIPTAGVYEVTAEFTGDISHKSSTTTALLTIYNPEGGFVTGGGWIASPEGAYTDAPTLSGRANFGFVSKYQKGASTPTGQTEFQFKVADLNFHSDNYEWLVVAGARAQYKGTGTINGAGNYGFMLTAIDEKLTPSTDVDMFRIKIWDKDNDAVVYDNQMGAGDDADPTTGIGRGSIVIHKQ